MNSRSRRIKPVSSSNKTKGSALPARKKGEVNGISPEIDTGASAPRPRAATGTGRVGVTVEAGGAGDTVPHARAATSKGDIQPATTNHLRMVHLVEDHGRGGQALKLGRLASLLHQP